MSRWGLRSSYETCANKLLLLFAPKITNSNIPAVAQPPLATQEMGVERLMFKHEAECDVPRRRTTLPFECPVLMRTRVEVGGNITECRYSSPRTMRTLQGI